MESMLSNANQQQLLISLSQLSLRGEENKISNQICNKINFDSFQIHSNGTKFIENTKIPNYQITNKQIQGSVNTQIDVETYIYIDILDSIVFLYS
jgi:hypothetical protein